MAKDVEDFQYLNARPGGSVVTRNLSPENLTINQKNKDRILMFTEYLGPDKTTIHLLNRFVGGWLENPLGFWSLPKDVGSASKCQDPLADLIHQYMQTNPCASRTASKRGLTEKDCWSHIFRQFACLVFAELRKPANGHIGLSCQELAVQLWNEGDFSQDSRKTEKVMSDMETAGHQYLLLEQNLGAGVCFLFGTDLSEGHFLKLLPKSGPIFSFVIKHIREHTTIPQFLSQRLYWGLVRRIKRVAAIPDDLPECDFAILRHRVVQAKVDHIMRRPPTFRDGILAQVA